MIEVDQPHRDVENDIDGRRRSLPRRGVARRKTTARALRGPLGL